MCKYYLQLDFNFMKTLFIKNSRSKSAKYLIGSIILLAFTVYKYIADDTQYPKGKSFYWVGIVLFVLTSSYFVYDFMNKTPLYTINDIGIYRSKISQPVLWRDLYSFECKTYYRHVTRKVVYFFDKDDRKIFSLDLSSSDISLERMARILKTKLKEQNS
jgi:hypothetical protein